MHGFSLGFHRRALGLVELAVAIGVEFLEHFRFALFHLGLHLFAHRLTLLFGKFAVAVLVKPGNNFRRQLVPWAIRVLRLLLSDCKRAGPNQGSERDPSCSFHN